MPKVRLEIVIPDDREDDVVKAICEASHTGTIGDGKIFILPVGKAVRIRTGELNEDAL
jgi:nitrogen regulatory protein P-II 1